MDHKLKEIVNCLKEAQEKGMLLEKSSVLTGYSGVKLMGSLQRLSKILLDEENCYLEVGVFQGLTLLSTAMVNPKANFYGIDNFEVYFTLFLFFVPIL